MLPRSAVTHCDACRIFACASHADRAHLDETAKSTCVLTCSGPTVPRPCSVPAGALALWAARAQKVARRRTSRAATPVPSTRAGSPPRRLDAMSGGALSLLFFLLANLLFPVKTKGKESHFSASCPRTARCEGNLRSGPRSFSLHASSPGQAGAVQAAGVRDQQAESGRSTCERTVPVLWPECAERAAGPRGLAVPSGRRFTVLARAALAADGGRRLGCVAAVHAEDGWYRSNWHVVLHFPLARVCHTGRSPAGEVGGSAAKDDHQGIGSRNGVDMLRGGDWSLRPFVPDVFFLVLCLLVPFFAPLPRLRRDGQVKEPHQPQPELQGAPQRHQAPDAGHQDLDQGRKFPGPQHAPRIHAGTTARVLACVRGLARLGKGPAVAASGAASDTADAGEPGAIKGDQRGRSLGAPGVQAREDLLLWGFPGSCLVCGVARTLRGVPGCVRSRNGTRPASLGRATSRRWSAVVLR